MPKAESLPTFSSLVSASQVICIFFPEAAPADIVLSAVTLGLVLQDLGKTVTISSPEPVSDDLKQFFGVDKVTSELGNKNLDVSFPYQEEQVDKVSYHIDEEQKMFHLVIQPKKGERPIDASQVQFALTGAEADLIITIGVDRLESLDHIYLEHEGIFTSTDIVSVYTSETTFGIVKMLPDESGSYSEKVTLLLPEINGNLDSEMATNLLAGLESATQTFKSLSVTPQTFTVAAELMAKGARRVRLGDKVRK